MVPIRTLLSAVFLLWIGFGTLSTRAQTPPGPQPPPPFQFTVSPLPTNTVLVTQTTNTFRVTIGDLENFTNQFTNVTVVGIVPTNGYPTNLFTTNFLSAAGTNLIFRFNDAGRPPDGTADDGVFTGSIITPFTTVYTNLDIQIVVRAVDLITPNPDPNDTNALVVTLSTTLSYPVVPRPRNDAFAAAFKLDPQGGVGTGTNNFASIEFAEPRHAELRSAAASVWWTWSAGATTNVLIDTSGSSFRPVLAVYTGEGVSNLVLVASSTNDVVNQLQANVRFAAVRGTTYRIAVSGYDTNGVGDVRIRVAPGAVPDKSPPSLVISSPSRESTSPSNQLIVSGTAREASPLDSGIARVVLQVNGSAPTNASGTTSWFGTVTLPAGTNIVRAFAYDHAGNVSQADAVIVRFVSPAHDAFSSAQRVTGVGGLFTAQTTNSTREVGEPLHAGNEGGHSIWYSFRAGTAGTLSLTTSGSTFDTVLGVYTGDAITNLIEVASNDDAFEFSGYSELLINVVSNQLYYIAVDGYGGAVGTSQLQVAFVSPTPGQFYSLDVQPLPGGAVSPPPGSYQANARVTLTATPDKDYEFVGWEGTVSSPENPFVVTVNQNLSLFARFRVAVTNYTDDFETGRFSRLPWNTTSSAPWIIQTNQVSSGRFAARSGAVDHGRSSSLVLISTAAAGTGSFDLKVSSESGWDYLEFYLNGVLKERWSGEVGWTNYPFAVVTGTNRLEWRYTKDVNFGLGEDAAFIDNLYIPAASLAPGVGAATLAVQLLPNRQSQLTLLGEPGRTYTLESSTDMVVWLPLSTASSPSGVLQFIDRQAPGFQRRFYRALGR